MIYLESFMLPPENRQVYPYKQMYDKGLEVIDFAPITIFYGSNGSGKSTLLNIIASKVGVNNKTLGNTSEYFDGFVRKCTDVSMQIPTDSMFIRSEDIMELIADRRKKNASLIKREYNHSLTYECNEQSTAACRSFLHSIPLSHMHLQR